MIITNIGMLVGVELPGDIRPCLRGTEISRLNCIADAWLKIEGGRFAGFGSMSSLSPETISGCQKVIDARGGYVYPSFCDSHTHIVYAGSREGEFLDKINGLSYEEIARRGGGILNSADRLHDTPEQELLRQAMERVREVEHMGTGCIEIKSGYGLTLNDELKMLRVIARISESTLMKVRPTFLGAHAVGRAYAGRQADYVRHVCDDMIPAVSAEGLADFVDVFCDEGFFTVEETEAIMEAGARYGMRPKIHANELAASGGVQAGVAHGALSVDHLERAGEAEISVLAASDTAATMLPGASFFLGMPYAPARKAIFAGAVVNLASDYNPGSSPSGNMRFVASLGCIRMKLTPAEAINATTLNGAYAMGTSAEYGSIAEGKVANFYITRPMSSPEFYLYAYNTPVISRIFLRGIEI